MIVSSVKLYHPKEKNKWIDESPINGWLVGNVGKYARFRDCVDEDRPWSVDHEHDYLVYHFAREKDALMFALMWSK